jgi:hypothetical protein
MKTQTKSAPIIASEGLNGSLMGMDQSGQDAACYFFRDKIYSDKIEAVVREYLCNAIDEHKKFGIDKPVDFGLRANTNDPMISDFFVRDYAKGLSEEGVTGIFGQYFKSTKSHSNESIGGFGVGSKAGHCYTDSFNVVSYYGGQKTTYICALGGGNNGVDVGKIYKMDSEPTTETGIEINLQTNHEHKTFKEKCQRFLCTSASPLTLHLWDKSQSNEKEVARHEVDGYIVRVLKNAVDVSATNYSLRCRLGEVWLKMGEIGYVNMSNYSRSLYAKEGYNLSVECPIGALDIPVSREGITDKESNKRVVAKAKKVLQDYVDSQFSEFTSKSLGEKVCYIMSVAKEAGQTNTSRISSGVSNIEAEYIETNYDSLCGDHKSLVENMKSYSNFELTKESEAEKCPTTNKPLLIVIPATRARKHWLAKVETHALEKNKKFFIVSPDEYGTLRVKMEDQSYLTELEDHFTLVDAKKLKYTRAAKGQKKESNYVVWRNAYKLDFLYNTLTFHNLIMSEMGKKEVSSLDSAKKQIANIKKSLTEKELPKITLSSHKTTYNNNGVSYFIGAKNLVESLVSIGYLEQDSSKYRDLKSKFDIVNHEKRSLERYDSVLTQKGVVWVTPKIKKLLKKTKHLKRYVAVLQRIREEETLRGRLVANMIDSYYSPLNKSSRSEIRQLLNIK